MTDEVEAVARAIFEVDRAFHEEPLPERHFKVAIAQYQARARAAIAAMRDRQEFREKVIRLSAEHAPALNRLAWQEGYEAAAERIKVLEEALRGVLKWAEPIAGDNRDEKAAAFELATTETARAALTPPAHQETTQSHTDTEQR